MPLSIVLMISGPTDEVEAMQPLTDIRDEVWAMNWVPDDATLTFNLSGTDAPDDSSTPPPYTVPPEASDTTYP